MNLLIVKKLLSFAEEHIKDIYVSSLLAIMSSFLSVAVYFLAYLYIATITGMQQADISPYQLAGATALAIVLRYVLLIFSSSFAHRAAFNTLHTLRIRLVKAIGEQPLSFFNSHDSGALNTVVGEDVENVEKLLAHHIPDVVSSIVMPVVIVAVLAYQNILLALCTLIPMSLAFMVQRKIFVLRNKNIREFHDLRERMNSVIIEFICCLPVIKAFSLTTASYRKYAGAINSFTDFMCPWCIKSSRYYALFKMFLSSGIMFIVPAGVYLILQGESNAVELSLFLLMGLALTAPLDRLLLFAGSLSLIIESVSRIDDILHAEPLPVLSPEQTPEAFDVVFEHVSFSYGERTVLSDVTLTLKNGTKTAFVGYSGAGKTTATQLLARYHDPDKGRILIGGVDIRFINSHELASCMSLVMQNTFLFNDTVENNIRAGNTRCSFQDVTHAAEAACALEFIEKLEQGFQTTIGNGGRYLSGGELQRIAIARAMLKNAPLLVMDEATAFADPENEIRILQGMKELAREKTVIIIAHRLPTIADADQIVFFADGKVASSGTHVELLETCPQYAQLWKIQSSSANWSLRGTSYA